MAASPELERAIKHVKDLMSKQADSIAEMRRNIADSMSAFNRVEDDVLIETVDAAEFRAEWIVAPNAAADRVVVFFHGGSYIVCSAATHRDFAGRLSRASGARVLNIDYRLAPEHPFPAAIEDAKAAYQWLLDRGFETSDIAFAGDSAGGGLLIAALLATRDAGIPMPAAAVCMSPWVDLECNGHSMVSKASVDPFVSREPQRMLAGLYLDDTDPRNPLASPVHADLQGLCPLLIQVGSSETLLDDANRLAENAEQSGVDVTLQVWEDMIHSWHVFASFLPEGQRAIEVVGRFLHEQLQD